MGCTNAASGPQYEVWITTDRYNRMLACLKAGAICSAGITLVDPEVLLLRGVLLNDGTMLLGPMYDVPAGIPELPPNAGGNFTLKFLASDGSLLSSTSFVLSFSDVVEGYKVQLDEVPFGFSVALPPATYSIQIQHAGKVLVNVTLDSKLLKSAISSLPDKAFDKNPEQRRNALLNKIDAFGRMLSENNVGGALQKLQNDIKPHVQEWVVDYQEDSPLQLSKTEILQLIDRIIARLSAQSGTFSGNHHSESGLGGETFSQQLLCISSCPESLNVASPTVINRIHSIIQLVMDDLRQFGSLVGLRTGFAGELACATRDYLNLLSSFCA